MAKLSIRGDSERGYKVIELLKNLGGKNSKYCNGTNSDSIYFINDDNDIDFCHVNIPTNHTTFTLEEFHEKFPHKVGDIVLVPGHESEFRIDSMIWDGCEILYSVFVDEVRWYSAAELTVFNNVFINMEDINREFYKEEINCKVDDNSNHTDIKISYLSINDEDYADQIEINLGDNYEYKFEMNRLYILKKKPQYPKTYKECCDIMDIDVSRTIEHDDCPFYKDVTCYEHALLSSLVHLRKLIICRNTYWKIAGEELGLEKPWEPDWKDEHQGKCVITLDLGHIVTGCVFSKNHILAFPTEEMRDAFYENFKDLIEQCKELL